MPASGCIGGPRNISLLLPTPLALSTMQAKLNPNVNPMPIVNKKCFETVDNPIENNHRIELMINVDGNYHYVMNGFCGQCVTLAAVTWCHSGPGGDNQTSWSLSLLPTQCVIVVLTYQVLLMLWECMSNFIMVIVFCMGSRL